jgi:hypothetical protein
MSTVPDFLPPDETPVPACACGEPMTKVTWREPAIEGGSRDVTGFACSTDGCEGNFPQRWAKAIEEHGGQTAT